MQPRKWKPGDPVKLCGGCTACCRVLGVREFGKPAGVWCDHCERGSGCRIYQNRPQSCREFMCLWKTSPAMGDELRPDRCKIIFEMTEDGKVALAMTRYPDAIEKTSSLRELAAMLHAQGVSILIVDPGSGRDPMLWPAPGATLESVQNSMLATLAAQEERERNDARNP